MASGTKGNVFAALTDIENTEKIYLDNGVYKRNTALGSSWDLRIVHELSLIHISEPTRRS